LSTRRSNQPFRAGPYGAFLGSAYDPIWTEFSGEGTKTFKQENRGVVQEFRDPYAGIHPDCRFDFAAAALPEEMTLDRLARRRTLQQQMELGRRQLDNDQRLASYDRAGQTAFSLLTSRRLSEALNVAAEPTAVREQYGMTLFGQSSLVARRLIEAGGRFVSVFWDEYGLADSAWDTLMSDDYNARSCCLTEECYRAVIPISGPRTGPECRVQTVVLQSGSRTFRFDPRNIASDPAAKIDGGGIETLVRCGCVQVQVIAGRSAPADRRVR
jgi:hypothetical protein